MLALTINPSAAQDGSNKVSNRIEYVEAADDDGGEIIRSRREGLFNRNVQEIKGPKGNASVVNSKSHGRKA